MKACSLSLVLLLTLILFGVSCSPNQPYRSNSSSSSSYSNYPVSAQRVGSVRSLYYAANIKRDLIPKGRHARRYYRPMRPRYITIHSTQNFSEGADALRHSIALKRGKLRSRRVPGGNRIGYLSWHFSVDQYRVVQHLPTNEQGEHADYDGPGNNYSIGIEMCENRGNSRAATVDRTAKLTAYLMHRHGIPLKNVVPHHHWPRWNRDPAHKNCPHFLLDNGRPGRKWRTFKRRINYYYRQAASGV